MSSFLWKLLWIVLQYILFSIFDNDLYHKFRCHISSAIISLKIIHILNIQMFYLPPATMAVIVR